MALNFEYEEGPHEYKKYLVNEKLQHPKNEIKTYKFKRDIKWVCEYVKNNFGKENNKVIEWRIYSKLKTLKRKIISTIINDKFDNYYNVIDFNKESIINYINIIIDYFKVINLAESLISSKKKDKKILNKDFLIFTRCDEKKNIKYYILLNRLLIIILDLHFRIDDENTGYGPLFYYLNKLNENEYDIDKITSINDIYNYVLNDNIKVSNNKTVKDFNNLHNCICFIKENNID